MNNEAWLAVCIIVFCLGVLLGAMATQQVWEHESVAVGYGEYYLKNDSPGSYDWRWKK